MGMTVMHRDTFFAERLHFALGKEQNIFFLKNSLPSAYKTTLGKEEMIFFKKTSLPSASNNALGKEDKNCFLKKVFAYRLQPGARQS